MMTSITLSTVAMGGSVEISSASGGRSRSILFRMSTASAAQLAVEPLVVLLGELAGRLIGLGVADLAVLRLLARLEVGELGRPRDLPSVADAPVAQRRGHEPGDQHDDGDGEQELQHGVAG